MESPKGEPKSLHQPWFDSIIKTAIRKRNWLRKKNHEAYTTARSNCRKLIAAKKRNYYGGMINIRNPTKLWKVLKCAASLNVTKGSSIDPNLYPKLAEHFQRFNSEDEIRTGIGCNSYRVTTAQVKKCIKRQKSRRAVGLDGLSMKLIKRYQNLLAGPLTVLFNRILESNEIPNDWKLTRLTPVPKNKFPKDHTEYRPISIISSLPAIFEALVAKQLQTLLTD